MRKTLFIPFVALILLMPFASAIPALVYDNLSKQVNGDGSVTVEFDVLNTGNTEWSGQLLVEMQPLGENEKFFSVYTTEQKTCDASYPDNVHKLVIGTLQHDERVHVSLTTSPLQAGTYQLKGVSTDGCCTGSEDLPADGECSAEAPFGWGSSLGTITVPLLGQESALCGNTICEAAENSGSCASDCGSGFEGDGICSAGENIPNEPACAERILSRIPTPILLIGIFIVIAGVVWWLIKKR